MKTSLRHDQRGFGHLMMIVLILLVSGIVGFAGWRVLYKDKSADQQVAKTGANSCMDTYKDQVLCSFAEAYADFNETAYTAVDNSTDNMDQTSQITIKNDGQGNLSIASQAGNSATNSIIMGNTTYVQDGPAWIKYTSGAPTVNNPSGDLKLQFSNADTAAKQRVKYKRIGQEACGQATCYKYQVIDPDMTGTTYIWFNSRSYQLQRVQVQTGDGTDDITITYGPVTITAPSPTTTPAEASAATYESWMQNAAQDDQ